MLLEARGLVKVFPGVVALKDATLKLPRGQTHALLGENGAGKSTLLKILTGVHAPDGGELIYEGGPLTLAGPGDATAKGIAIIHQELSLVPDLSIAENIFLGDEPLRRRLPDFATMRARAKELIGKLGLTIDPGEPVRGLTVAEQQLVEIARSLRRPTRLLAMDEPTAALSHRESERLFDVIGALERAGTTILYVSHRLAEVFRLCKRATILRDGSTVGDVPLGEETKEDEVVRMMVGREVKDLYPRGERTLAKPRLTVKGLAKAPRFHGIDLEVRGGEIVGLAGLVGAGRTDVIRGIFGADRPDAGTVAIDGQPLALGDPAAAVRAGIGLLTEDRKHQGLAMGRSIRENASLAFLTKYSKGGVIDEAAEAKAVEAVTKKLRLRASHLDADVASLSGGNQQKVLIARWLLGDVKVLLADEPTRGIDVGARAEIYELLAELAREGLAVLVVSSDLPEVLGLCDRILVMADGKIQGELTRAEATEEKVLTMATPKGKVAS